MPRFLFVHSGSDLYGASRSLLRLTTRLVTDGHPVMAVLPHHGPLVPALQAAGVQAEVDPRLVILTRSTVADHQGPLAQLTNLPRSVAGLIRRIADFKPDLIHTNTSVVVSSPLAARIARVPHVWHMREFYKDFPRLWPYYQKFMTGFSDRVVCVSGAVARQFADARNVRVLHNGFPGDEFAAVDTARIAAFCRRFNVDNVLRVGIVGRIKYQRKGQETFVRAAALLARQHEELQFLIVGSPYPGNEDHLARLRALVDELSVRDRIVFTGDIDDIKAVYAALDVAVLASSSPEPFGGVVIEAMAMGRPVVGTRVGGTPEQIDHGTTGFLVTPDSPEEMADAIARLVADRALRDDMGRAARERFLREFEFEAFYRGMWTVYDEVLRSRSSNAVTQSSWGQRPPGTKPIEPSSARS